MQTSHPHTCFPFPAGTASGAAAEGCNRGGLGSGRGVRSTREAGFTISEMLAAMSIFVTLGVTAVPIFSDTIQSYNLHGATREVFAQLQATRMAAVSENTRYRLQLTAGGTLFIDKETTSGWTKTAEIAGWPADTPGIVVTASGEIIFAANGTAPSYGSFVLLNANGSDKTVAVGPAGLVRIE